MPGAFLFPPLLPPLGTELSPPLLSPPPLSPPLILFLPAPDLPVSPMAALFFLPFFLALLMFMGNRMLGTSNIAGGKWSVRIEQWSEWSSVSGQWLEWGSWSACSSTCFNIPGVRTRTRTCPTNPPTCLGNTSENEACAGEVPCQIY